ncbi:EI24 domain-containing protein [Herbiconiux sp. L3-i23]|uniref:EI24 domain-containing protein n=1 Tax=Herbiconiux sp. L3-i23 TaxID=2905871 RepID=UPI00206ADA29|nr:EI24 domain-containing protein [Herbiconiux sp. L3-i23]BDI23127.1 membrane protein [Herbiconiux sp. L3-i23]
MIREFGHGVALFLRGFRMWATSPKLMLLGAVPAFIVGILVLTVFVVITANLDALALWVTPFAAEWDEPWRALTRLAAGIALFLVLVLLAVSTFTALTLAIGDPFYERIWLAVEARLGGFQAVDDLGFWASLRRGTVAGLRLLVPSVALGLALFAIGFIPVVGGVVALVLGALIGGRLLAVELLARPLDGRGLDGRAQKALRRAAGARVGGFGTSAYLLFLLPLGAVFAMPAAVAGSAVLARELVEQRGLDGEAARDA